MLVFFRSMDFSFHSAQSFVVTLSHDLFSWILMPLRALWQGQETDFLCFTHIHERELSAPITELFSIFNKFAIEK